MESPSKRQRLEYDSGNNSARIEETINAPDAGVSHKTPAPESLQQWSRQDGLLLDVFSYLSVVTLVETKQVCKKWQELCTKSIKNKCEHPKNFKTNNELRTAAQRYCQNNPDDIEEIATTYGYPINEWPVQEVEDFSQIFKQQDTFNEDISSWDLSNAKNMNDMFFDARSFNQPLPWDTSNVSLMDYLFAGATSFNQPLPWDTSSVTSMEYLFASATSFNQPLPWDTSKVTSMEYLFGDATSFNQPLPWNTSNVTSMESLFWGATSFNQPLPWDTSKVTNMRFLFCGATAFNQPLSWDTSSVTSSVTSRDPSSRLCLGTAAGTSRL